MSMKKAKGKGKGTAKKAAKKSARRATKKVDIVQVRENITNMVGSSAKDIATEVIKVAKTGQLASAKYLFEAVGLYPPTEETAAKPEGDSFAHTLLKRLGLPTEPVICEEDPEPVLLPSFAKEPGKKKADADEEDIESELPQERGSDSANAEDGEDGEDTVE